MSHTETIEIADNHGNDMTVEFEVCEERGPGRNFFYVNVLSDLPDDMDPEEVALDIEESLQASFQDRAASLGY